VKTTGLNPNVAAAWLRNEEPAISQNTDPAGHGRYNFLNVGITDNKSYSAASPLWQNPVRAGQATGNWLAGRLSLPGYGKSSSGIQGITRTAGLTPQEQIRAIQQSGWASGGETALPGLYRQASGGGGIQLGAATTPAATPASSALLSKGAPSVAPLPQMSLAPLQQQFTLGAQQNQRALDALGAISGRSVEAPQAPDLSALTQSQTPQPPSAAPSAPQPHVAVPLNGKIPKGLDPQAQKAVALAHKYIGTPYVFGGAKPGGFDCSGLVVFIGKQLGITVPRTAAEQFAVGKPVSRAQLQPGDPIFFRNQEGIHHEGLYIGNDQFIQAPHTGDHVKISSLSDPYYASQFAGGRRVF
jgi:cell wall-associated NlpC family hydrolase